jgi:NAD(P)H-dependent FMN reductase
MHINVLALSGSQRERSWSSALLRAAQAAAPPDKSIRLHEGHKQWPLFNPDLESDPPAGVLALREELGAADALLIASPEYAHGVSGTIKNTLDWLVSFPPFAGKPVGVFNPAYQSHHADEALKETLRIMSAELVPGACIRVPVIGSGIGQDAIADQPAFRAALSGALRALAEHVRLKRLGVCPR